MVILSVQESVLVDILNELTFHRVSRLGTVAL